MQRVALVGTALAGTCVYIDPVGLNMEHTDAPRIRIRRIAREYRLSSGADDRWSSYDEWLCGGIEDC